MKKIFIIFIDLLIFIAHLIIAYFINYLCLILLEKSSIIRDSSRLGILFVPIVIYTFFIFISILNIKSSNKKLSKISNHIIINTSIYFLLLLLICSIIFIIFKIEKNREEEKNDTVGEIVENTILPAPDRIIYKNQYNEYIIIEDSTPEYVKIYTEFYNQISNIIEGKVYSEEEITQMQESGSFVEFDYNRISKNFVFMLNEKDIGIIKRFSDSGQVIKTSLDNTDELVKKLDKLTKNYIKYYSFNKDKSYTFENKSTQISSFLYTFSNVENGVYQKKILDSTTYNELLAQLNLKSNETLPSINFPKESLIVTISQYEIKDIRQNIGNIKYEFGKNLNEYCINFLVVSNIVNTNCIYYNITDFSESIIQNEITENYNTTNTTNIENDNISKDDYAVDYYLENTKYYVIRNNKKIEIISLDKACDLADEEAKNGKYQYQPWKSEFYSRGKNKNDYISAELISNLSDINRLYFWNKNWEKINYENVDLMWQIRLSDENDPLTSLYIYIDAINGSIVGAGNASD